MVHVLSQEPVPLHGFDDSLQFDHRSLRLQDERWNLLCVLIERGAERGQIGAGFLDVAAGGGQVLQRHLQLVHRVVRVGNQGLQAIGSRGIIQQFSDGSFAP